MITIVENYTNKEIPSRNSSFISFCRKIADEMR